MAESFEEKSLCVLTGASRGIGREIAFQLSAKYHEVLFSSLLWSISLFVIISVGQMDFVVISRSLQPLEELRRGFEKEMSFPFDELTIIVL